MIDFPISDVEWHPCFRVVPSRFPPVDLFEGINDDPGDWELLNELEGATSSRLREQSGQMHLVNDEDRRFGPGYSPVMAAFCYLAPGGSRFADSTFGAYYCALTEATAVAETRHHTQRFMRESSEPPMMLQKRVYLANLNAPLIDLRGQPLAAAHLDPDDWSVGQRLGREARAANHYGIVYPSVRDPDGECAAVLRPPALSATWQGKHLGYEWDGARIRAVVELRATDY